MSALLQGGKKGSPALSLPSLCRTLKMPPPSGHISLYNIRFKFTSNLFINFLTPTFTFPTNPISFSSK